jgi:hypothetical protein
VVEWLSGWEVGRLGGWEVGICQSLFVEFMEISSAKRGGMAAMKHQGILHGGRCYLIALYWRTCLVGTYLIRVGVARLADFGLFVGIPNLVSSSPRIRPFLEMLATGKLSLTAELEDSTRPQGFRV